MLRPGDSCHFTYRCWENEQSQDAELWHHTGQSVVILHRLSNIDEAQVGRMYRVEFADGFRYDVFEDELQCLDALPVASQQAGRISQ